MSSQKSLEELEAENQRRHRFGVSTLESAGVTPEEQKRIIAAFCQQFKGILNDKNAIPTVEQIIQHLETTEGIKRDPENRSVSVPRHSDPTQIEQAVYAAVLVLMATDASSLVSPSGGEPKELFALATALIASNAAIAEEQIDTVVATLKEGKSSLSEEDQDALDTVIAVMELNSQLITESNARGETLSEQDRRNALLQAIASSDKFPDPTSKKKAEEVIKKCDARFLEGSNKLAKPVVAASAESFRTTAEPIPAPSPVPEPKTEHPKANTPVGGGAPPQDLAEDKEKVVKPTTRQRRSERSASVGSQSNTKTLSWLPKEVTLDTPNLSVLSKEQLESYHKLLTAEITQHGKEGGELATAYKQAQETGQPFPFEKFTQRNAKKDVLVGYVEKYQAEVQRRNTEVSVSSSNENNIQSEVQPKR